jgi:hypothetical protein
MASLYKRKDSPFYWIRYKDTDGQWRSSNTGYRKDKKSDQEQVHEMLEKKKREELIAKPVPRHRVAYQWDQWVPAWMEVRWAGKTIKEYRRYYRYWTQYFAEKGITHPAALTREKVLEYINWRDDACKNTCIQEIKFLAQIMKEAIKRKYYTDENPARDLDLEPEDTEDKVPWTEAEVALVDAELLASDKFGWMRVTFLMGRYQALRLRQAQVPLRCIDFTRQQIDYPGYIVKGGKKKQYSQRIDDDLLPHLKEIVAHRRSIGSTVLCEVPLLASVEWRSKLNSLGLQHLVHHGLRATWITQAALSGAFSETLAKKFANHASSQVHAIYQKINALAEYRRMIAAKASGALA